MVTIAQPLPPTNKEAARAKELSRKLAPLAARSRQTVQVQIAGPGKPRKIIELPASAMQLLVRILAEMGKGNAVTLTPVHAQLTTQQAAELLGVSRPFIVKQLRQGKIPFQRVGTHRRVKYSDLMAYRDRCRASQNEAMDELASQAQELNMGY